MLDLLKPLLDLLLQLLASGVLAAGGWAITHYTQKLRLTNDDVIRGYLNDALAHAVEFGIAQVHARLGTDADPPDDLNAAVTHAATYVAQRVPDALAHFGISGAALDDMVRARLAKALG